MMMIVNHSELIDLSIYVYTCIIYMSSFMRLSFTILLLMLILLSLKATERSKEKKVYVLWRSCLNYWDRERERERER